LRAIRLAAAAERDLAAILQASETRFGTVAADRYRRLIAAAFRDLQADPARRAVRQASPELNGLSAYHVRHSRGRTEGQRVMRPRHLIVFNCTPDLLIVHRVLHDAMDLPSQLRDL
jgi:toxin ParE1/3/4